MPNQFLFLTTATLICILLAACVTPEPEITPAAAPAVTEAAPPVQTRTRTLLPTRDELNRMAESLEAEEIAAEKAHAAAEIAAAEAAEREATARADAAQFGHLDMTRGNIARDQLLGEWFLAVEDEAICSFTLYPRMRFNRFEVFGPGCYDSGIIGTDWTIQNEMLIFENFQRQISATFELMPDGTWRGQAGGGPATLLRYRP